VSGDVILINAGDAIHGDGLILVAKDLFVDESVLTGESYPAEKEAFKTAEGNATVTTKSNFVFEGSHIIQSMGSSAFLPESHERAHGNNTEDDRGIKSVP